MNSFGNSKHADSLFQSEDYFYASIEYERLIFYAVERPSTNVYLYKKALCYKNTGDYSKALNELQTIYLSSKKDTLYAHVAYQQAYCHYLNNEPLNALWKIEEFFNRTNDTITYQNFIPLEILCHNELQSWDEAKTALTSYIDQNIIDNNLKKQYLVKVDSLYNKKKIPRILKVKTAKNLSRFIPGSGQMYAGKIGEGTVNLLINASILTFAIHQLYHRFYVTGYLGGLGLLNQTYTGGIKRAGVVAAQGNKNRMNEYNQEINSLLKQILK